MADAANHTLSPELQARLDEAQVAQAEAEARGAATKAAKDAADARTAQLTALVPDLSKVKDSTLEVKDGTTLFGRRLTFRALATAAAKVAEEVKEHTADLTVLVTTDPDLASADAGYTDVTTGLEQLQVAALALLVPDWGSRRDEHENLRPFSGIVPNRQAAKLIEGLVTGPIPAVATAVATALPSVLSLLSAQRSVTTGTADPSNLAAAAAVAGALLAEKAGPAVLLDDFRLVPKESTVYAAAAEVAQLRQRLVAEKLGLEDDAARSAAIDTVVTAIDQFTTAMRTVPQAGGRSPLAAAALHEEVHPENGGITRVLLVNSQPGQLLQVTENRPLWFKDRFTTLAEVGLLYVLIDTACSNVLAAGTATAVAKAFGSIGKDFTLTPE